MKQGRSPYLSYRKHSLSEGKKETNYAVACGLKIKRNNYPRLVFSHLMNAIYELPGCKYRINTVDVKHG